MQAGEGNIYAPEVHRFDARYWMWYGGQGRDGHDRILLAFSTDGLRWVRHPRNPVIDVGGANHVNDPSCVVVNERYYVFYSRAPVDEMDEIHLAVSADGKRFEVSSLGRPLIPLGDAGAWDSYKVGRPSVLHESGGFRMWYDGTNSDPVDRAKPAERPRRCVGLATSADGVRWEKYAGNPVVEDAGAVDVTKVGDNYVMLVESGEGTRWLTSRDGIQWTNRGRLFGLSGESYDQGGHVTPMAFVQDGQWTATYFGAAREANWNRNCIAVAFSQKRIEVRDAGGEAISAVVRAVDADTVEVRFEDGAHPKRIVVEVEPGGPEAAIELDTAGSSRFRLDGSQLVPAD
jgi:sucrose-6-phosphate hydrolase SacC (GH32 family)